MKRMFCPNCLEERDVREIREPEVFVVRGEDIEVADAMHFQCSICGNQIFDMETEERNLKAAYDAYRKKHNLLKPEEIRAIRLCCGMSQRAFAKALGWKLQTVHRYESGALQEESHDAVLREVAKNPSMLLK